ncbi:MAG TPA: hypothetical protein VGD80_03965 [Kofleriaceae bacterium]
MKKPARRDAKPGYPLQPLDRRALEQVSAGHKTVDRVAGWFRAFQPADGDGPTGE